MAHDFAKQRAARANRSARPGPAPWLWLVSGIVIGTLTSFLVYLATLAPQPQPQPQPPVAASAPGKDDARAAAPAGDPAKKPAAVPAAKPQFDFYDILRNTEGAATASAPADAPAPAPAATPPAHGTPGAQAPVEVPEPRQAAQAVAGAPAATPPAATPPAPKPAEPAKPAGFAMQAGAFSRHADADRRRGEILLLGYDARIEPVKLPDGQTRYRVTVGPFKDAQAMANARRALRDIGIETM
jgi:hypothetical protein